MLFLTKPRGIHLYLNNKKQLEYKKELNNKYSVLQKDGLLLKMEGRYRELFEKVFEH